MFESPVRQWPESGKTGSKTKTEYSGSPPTISCFVALGWFNHYVFALYHWYY